MKEERGAIFPLADARAHTHTHTRTHTPRASMQTIDTQYIHDTYTLTINETDESRSKR